MNKEFGPLPELSIIYQVFSQKLYAQNLWMRGERMDDSLLQELSVADGPEEMAAVAAEFIFSTISKDAALIARRCSVLHWFDETIVEVFLKEIPSPKSQLSSV